MWQPFSDQEASSDHEDEGQQAKNVGMAQRTKRRVIMNESWTSSPGLEGLPELFCEADNVLCMQATIN